jgi:iron(III) transport system substrate-binding protein
MTRLRLGALIALAVTLLGAPARSATDPVGDAGLIAKARAEGSVLVYSSVSVGDSNGLAQRFQAQYGITVHVLRLESNQIPARMLVEQRAGTTGADLALAPTLQMYALKSLGILTAERVPEERDYMSAALDKGGAFGGVLINTDAIVFNPDKLKAAHLSVPHSWADLTRPEWRGQFAIFNHSYEWYLAMKKTLGGARAQALMRGLAANQPRLVASHQLAVNGTADGEFVAAANAFAYDAARQKRDGRPIEFVNAPPTVAEVNAVGVVGGAPHPNAALLFKRWAMSRDTQQFIVSTLGRCSGRTDVKPADPAVWNDQMQIVISDPSNPSDYQQASHEFDEIFHTRVTM